MNLVRIALLRTVLLCLFFTACKKSDDTLPGGSVVPAQGVWKVTYFYDKGDETADFSGYTFNFANNGTVTATQGSQTWTGTWSSGYDDSKNKFLIDFISGSPSPLSELEEDWLIVKMDDQLMHFEHTSGGNGDTDVLKFEKK